MTDNSIADLATDHHHPVGQMLRNCLSPRSL